MHGTTCSAYGEWYSSSVWPQQRDEPAPFMEALAAHRITDGQELRGFVAGSLVRLADEALLADPAEWVAKAFARSFTLDAMGVSGQSNWDCAHAAGYGARSLALASELRQALPHRLAPGAHRLHVLLPKH